MRFLRDSISLWFSYRPSGRRARSGRRTEGKYFPLKTEQTMLIRNFIMWLLMQFSFTCLFLSVISWGIFKSVLLVSSLKLSRKRCNFVVSNLLLLIICKTNLDSVFWSSNQLWNFPSKRVGLSGKRIPWLRSETVHVISHIDRITSSATW